jgi:hypothetical protein
MHLIVLEKEIAQHLRLLDVLPHNLNLTLVNFAFLGVFTVESYKNMPISFPMSACNDLRTTTYFHETWYWGLFLKFVDTNSISG